ncbi:hypothetical protein AJ80_07000 [Polytolypa hystricis UAMH7299]|uniref:Uncharacterized protein n=1 Tax=Polytolypa hystricis (strain UAMH7299) TaxID=1447883 RepID=A0A2B7XS01_POLH7|nr:hypothetical protein AJ80_07000 [Polytolypa hystricis UAMH7299]
MVASNLGSVKDDLAIAGVPDGPSRMCDDGDAATLWAWQMLENVAPSYMDIVTFSSSWSRVQLIHLVIVEYEVDFERKKEEELGQSLDPHQAPWKKTSRQRVIQDDE